MSTYSVCDGLFSAGTLVQVQGQSTQVQSACSVSALKFGHSVASLPYDSQPEQFESSFNTRLKANSPRFWAELQAKNAKFKADKQKKAEDNKRAQGAGPHKYIRATR